MAYSRGLKLPPRGSAHDEIIALTYQREREEKYSMVSMFAFLLGSGLGVPEKSIQRMLELYGLELYQDRYRPAYTEKLRRTKRDQSRKALADTQLLDRVAKLEVPDEVLPMTPKKKRRR